MAPKFIFEAPSDEELELEFSHSDGEEEDQREEGGDDGREEGTVHRKNQSPWDFSSNFESVDEEHARRGTTSVDAKISKLRNERSIPVVDVSEPDVSDSESNRQEDYRPDDDDEEEDDEEEHDEPEEEQEENEDGEEDEEEQAEDGEEDDEEQDEDGEEDDEEQDEEDEEEEEEEEEEEGSAKAVEKKPFFASSDGASFHANSFMELNLSRPLLRACKELGFTKPTPIQAACIPLALAGRDICGSAMTGSGKTAAFALPTLERLLFRPKRDQAIRVLILTPTRELAAQVHSMIEKLAQFTDIRCCLVVGGLDLQAQASALRSMPDIVVATPGRIIDHLTNSMSVSLDDLAVLILDEADRLLELGFSADIGELLRLCPKRRQTMLFSATMTEQVNELIKLSLTKPLRLSADPSTKRPSTLTEEVVRLRRMREVNQEAVLLALCSKTFTSKVIIFSGTKQAAHRLKILFTLFGLKAAELHGNLTQNQRLNALDVFKEQKVDFLIATDVAARGLDIVGVQTVINYACPRDLTSYVHRVGRTARAGRKGYAVTLVTDNDRSLLKAIAKRAGSKLKSRTVAEQSIANWSKKIEEMEVAVTAVLEEERQEAEFRKAEMEVRKAENLISHKDDIFSRPKKTWHISEKQKKLVAKAAKEYAEKGKGPREDVVSAQQAEDLKMKEKRKREREKNLPRRQRRKLEAAREMLEDEDHNDKSQGNGKNNKEKAGLSLVDAGYRRAKAVKAVKKALDSGKIVKKAVNKSKGPNKRSKSRTEENEELFQSDMSERKQKKSGGMGKRSTHSFKSKSRYKRK